MRKPHYQAKLMVAIYISTLIRLIFPELSNPPPPASAVISGSVTNSNAAPDNVVVGITVSAALAGTPTVNEVTTVTDANGNFTLPALANGTYLVTALFANADGSTLGASETVTLAGANVTAPVLALVRISAFDFFL